jgi:hypothetical protein
VRLVLFFVLFFLSGDVSAGSTCVSLFDKFELIPDKIMSGDNKKEALISDDGRFIKIVNHRTKSEYTYDSQDSVLGFFSLNSHAWIIPLGTEVQIWNFDRSTENLIRIGLKNPIGKPRISMYKNSAGETFLKIIYLRKKINPDNREYFETFETIIKSLESFIEERF